LKLLDLLWRGRNALRSSLLAAEPCAQRQQHQQREPVFTSHHDLTRFF